MVLKQVLIEWIYELGQQDCEIYQSSESTDSFSVVYLFYKLSTYLEWNLNWYRAMIE